MQRAISTMRSAACSSSVEFCCGRKFTGKQRDSESNLDYFGARYYASTMGRFLSPDWAEKPQPVPYADVTDPQSLNLYAYVKNNPTTSTDPNGHCEVEGQHHNWIWCALHATGWIQTKHEQAQSARREMLRYERLTGRQIQM